MPSFSSMNVDCDVVIAGAGISGLTTAFQLMRQGLRVEVIEAASRAGGVIGTECANDVLYERGHNSILDTSPLTGLDFAEDDLKRTDNRHRIGEHMASL